MTVQDQSGQAETTTATGVVLTDVAVAKVKSLLADEGRDDLRLRVQVQPGGCQGMKYELWFDDRSIDGDVVHAFDGVEVVVDRASVDKLQGARIDFTDTIGKVGFTIDNPNEGGRCACGDSFC